ncbi:MAG: double-strand break repair protein AddB [Xanthobacteraceae bacterium]|nr:double-strand break repair protein AddB [Xanthobacteraceae bacterium]
MHVFNIPASAPFLHTLIAALVDGRLIDGFHARRHPERLATVTLYLPTRRATRLARDVFLDVLDLDAAVLPRIVTLGDVDEDEGAFADSDIRDAFDLPPALDGLQRRLTLARLVGAWARQLRPTSPLVAPLVVGGPAATLALSADLARLMDDMATRGVDWRALDGLVPDALDDYWKLSLDFLKIAREIWPAYLEASGSVEPAIRRDLLIAAEAERLKAHPDAPVIAAGSTGSMPATAKLLHAIARLPRGAVVLPGLDIDLDDEAWHGIGGHTEIAPASNHPQFALHGLLARFGIERRDVVQLGAPAPHGREVLASEAMRPASATGQWHHRLAEPEVARRIADAAIGLAVIEAPNPDMEALAIAVAMRQARELNLSAALVTPDRALARRVMAALDRWQLAYDDSGGDPLLDTPAGILARLTARAACEGLEPPTLLALLKHPLFRLGRAQGGWGNAVEALELALLRGTRPAAGSAGLARDFATFRAELQKFNRKEDSAIHASEPRAKLPDADLAAAADLIAALAAALEPLENAGREPDFAVLAAKHRAALTRLAADDTGAMPAFDDNDGRALLAAFDDVSGASADGKAVPSGLPVPPREYAEVFQTALGDRVARQPLAADATLRIYGLLEARLTQHDRVIFGGLIEGTWPPAPRIDPWLSRPMRAQLGLDLPERRIGLSAHDFTQLLGSREVILSHAEKSGGAPTVASRFLHRLEATAGADAWGKAREAGATYLHYAAALDRPDAVKPIAQPAPKPPRALRPLAMSVTEIEDWLRDPYTIFAKRILQLTPLDPVDMPLTAADRGSAIHAALGDFSRRFARALPDDIEAALCGFGADRFAALMERPEARALWWPRFLRIAGWFAGWERQRRGEVARLDAEIRGETKIHLDDGRVFTLSARADRIEHRADRSFALLDYKTGMPPTGKQVRMGLSPQLTLEAAILRQGGFEGIPAGASVSELLYIRLSGNTPPGEERSVELKINRGDEPQLPDDGADEALRKLEALVRRFDDEAQGYTSLNLSMWANRYGRYDDLARVKEWSAAGGDDGGEA